MSCNNVKSKLATRLGWRKQVRLLLSQQIWCK
uniref:Uncharacterized protein n=1 Tax=Myoviridae sp. ctNQV2 TaxID=2827683 RepID=A0A8S5RZV7_9CAUD|nr:MAG TPA: hypothetical protein [Myoviridae sp. ctNQV2]